VDIKYCEDCATRLHVNRHKERKDGTVATQYKCPNCNTYATYYDKEVKSSPEYDIVKTVGPKILILDIETAPISAVVWRIWKENVGLKQIMNDWYILTWSAKWLGEDEVYADALVNHDLYDTEPRNDIEILKSIHTLISQADIIIAHNGDRFDMPKLNARFIYHGIMPPSPYKTIDTLKVAKYTFNFTSNKLAYLGVFLKVGGKIDTGGMELWTRCLDGDLDAYKEMLEYNIQDVKLLEDVYMKMRPWVKSHPNFGVYIRESRKACTACGSDNLKTIPDSPYAYTPLGRFNAYQCQDCGKWVRDRKNLNDKFKNRNLVTNAI